MDIGINTDFMGSTGSPEPKLKLIAEAGFTHLHWCHQWCTDFLYGKAELDQYGQWIRDYGLQLLDIHGSSGKEKCWFSPVEYIRKAGVELVLNRVIMLAELGGTGSLMMHAPHYSIGMNDEKKREQTKWFEALKRSLDELMPALEKYSVRIALENTFDDTFEIISEVMRTYPEKYLGITYDSGHGNYGTCQGLNRLEPLKGRLQALHLNDNDATGDLHQPPFMGTVDWNRMVQILAVSSYRGRPLSFELSMRNTPFYEKELETEQKPENAKKFLADAHERCARVVSLYETERKKNGLC